MPDQDEIAKFLAQDAESLVDHHARKYGVDPSLAKRILTKESALRPDVLTGGRRSKAGAIGPMQLMPGTAKELGVDPSNYEQNIEGGVKYLAQMQKQFGDPAKAAAAYNAGPGAVQKYGGVPPYAETRDYVKSVAGGDDIAEFLANDAQAALITPAKPLTRPAKPGPIRNPQRGPIAPTANPFATNQGATGFQEQAQKAYERTQGLGQGRPQGLAEAANQFKQAALKGFARIPQGISESLQMPVSESERRLAQTLGPNAGEDIRRREGGLRRAISQATEPVVKNIEQAYPVDPNDQSWMTQKIPVGAGSIVPMIASSILGRGLGAKSSATSALSGVAQSAGEVSERLNKAGIEGPQRDRSAALAIATGATEALGLGRALDKIGAKRAIMGRLGNVAEDVAQEYGQEYLGDVNAKLVGQYDKNASLSPISRNKLEAAALGGILGGAMQGAGALASKRPGAPLAETPVQPEPQQPLTRVDPLSVDARGKITGGRAPIQGTPRVVGTPQPSGPAQYSVRPNAQPTQVTKIPTGQEYAKLAAKPEAVTATEAPAQTIPAGNIAGIRVIAEGERIPASQRRNVKTIVVKQPDGSMQSVRAMLPEGMTPGQARQVLQGAQKAQAKAATPPTVAAQPTTEPLTPEAPAQVNPRQAARNENIQKAHEDSIAARTQAEAARREGRHDEAIRALTVEAEALRALRKQIPDRSRGGRVRRVEAGERLTQIQSEIKAAKIAQRQAVKAENAPTADLTGPIVPEAPQTARMPEAPNRITADLPRPMPRTTAEIPRPVAAPLTEPTNRLRNADYPGGEIPRTAGLRPEGQPVEIPADRVQENTNRLPGAEYAGGEVRTYQQPQAEGQPVDVSRRPPAPPRPVGPRSVQSGPQGQYGPTTMSAAFPRSRRGLVVEGRRVQGEIEAGRGDKGEYGKLAQSMFKSTRGDVLHGQDSFFHDADVKGALGLTRDAEQGEVRAALKTELARVMGVKSEEVSLTQVPPQAWQNWAGMKQLGEGARAKLQVAIQKYQSPILDELQKTANPPDSSPPRPISTDAGSTPKAPSDYQRLRDANAKAIAALNSVSATDAATPGGKRKFDAAADRLRKSAKQMGIDPSHADAIITDAMNAQMEAARRADEANIKPLAAPSEKEDTSDMANREVVRPAGWEAQNDTPDTWTRKGHFYRGMTDAEYSATVGRGRGVISRQDYSVSGEGTSFAKGAGEAEDYVNFGRTDPRKTGKPTYLVEISGENDLKADRDGYYKAAKEIPPNRIRRIWKMEASNGAVVATRIRDEARPAKAGQVVSSPARRADDAPRPAEATPAPEAAPPAAQPEAPRNPRATVERAGDAAAEVVAPMATAKPEMPAFKRETAKADPVEFRREYDNLRNRISSIKEELRKAESGMRRSKYGRPKYQEYREQATALRSRLGTLEAEELRVGQRNTIARLEDAFEGAQTDLDRATILGQLARIKGDDQAGDAANKRIEAEIREYSEGKLPDEDVKMLAQSLVATSREKNAREHIDSLIQNREAKARTDEARLNAEAEIAALEGLSDSAKARIVADLQNDHIEKAVASTLDRAREIARDSRELAAKLKVVADGAKIPDADKVEESVSKPKAKINKDTGLTNLQEEYVTETLKKNLPNLAQGDPLEIKVPGDGRFRVTTPEGANNLAVRMTGKPLTDVIPATAKKVQQTSPSAQVVKSALNWKPDMKQKPLTPEQAKEYGMETIPESGATSDRKPRVKSSLGKLDREESGGTTLGSGFGALQGAFKSKPPSGADLDAWMDRMGNAIPETMTDAQISRFDDMVNRAADAAEAGDAREWKRLSRQAEQMIFTRKDRAIAEVSGAMNATRSLMASGDLSAPLRQGAILTLPPSQWGKAGRAAKRMFQALSAGKYERLKQEIQVHPDFDAAEDAGLYLATNDSGRTRGEEDFLRNNSLASRIVERMPVLAHSERAYKMYLDSLRIDTFAKYKQVIEKGGGTDEQKAKALKSAAEWINVATGRGSLGRKFDESVPLLSTIFFAPRYTASRIQVLNPATYAKNLGNPASRQVFRRQMSEMFQSAAVLTTTAALAKYGLGATVNLDDPENPDWLKIKIGDTRYDVGAGLQQIARLGARIGKYLDTSVRGTEKERGAASDKMVRAVKTFGRSKLGPAPSFFVDWLNNWTNVIGERHTPGEASTKNPIISRITPLLWADMVDAYREGGAGKAARFTPGVFGVGVQDYDVNKKRKAETKARVRPKTPPMPGPPKGFGEL